MPSGQIVHKNSFFDSVATTRELCDCFGISNQYLGQLQSEGFLPASKRSTWPAYETIKAFIKLIRARKAAQKNATEETEGSYDFERTRKTRAEANIAEIESALLASKVLEAEAVKQLWTDQLYAAKNRILGIPSKIASRMPAEFSAEALRIATEQVHDALAEMADYSPKDIAKITNRRRLFKRSEQGDAGLLDSAITAELE